MQERTLKNYFAFTRLKNFACIEIKPTARKLLVYLKVDPESVDMQPGFTRDVSNIGHFGTGDLEVTVAQMEDLERAKPAFATELRSLLVGTATGPLKRVAASRAKKVLLERGPERMEGIERPPRATSGQRRRPLGGPPAASIPGRLAVRYQRHRCTVAPFPSWSPCRGPKRREGSSRRRSAASWTTLA